MEGDAIVGRLAPSPTGRLHLGHARSFLLAWWHVRARGGRVVLRLEDLDRSRLRAGMVDACLADLEWLGIDWDGPPVRQSADTSAMALACADLLRRGLAYPCVCTRAEVASLSAPHADDGEARYAGACRGRWRTREEARAASGREAGIRLRIAPGEVTIDDCFSGRHRFDVAAEVGDFLIQRRDGAFAYQLAVVIDDARQGVSEVLRGSDLLPSAARQWYVQQALGLPSPRWYHVPLVVHPDGERLAKRRDDLALATLREEGVDPRAVVGWVARVSGQDSGGLARASEVTARFSLERVPARAVVLSEDDVRSMRAYRATGAGLGRA